MQNWGLTYELITVIFSVGGADDSSLLEVLHYYCPFKQNSESMITRTSILTSLLLGSQVLAGTAPVATVEDPALASPEKSSFSGSFTTGVTTHYSGRGIVVSRPAVQGNGAEFFALKAKQELSESWSYDIMMAYTVASSGHTLYGNPSFGPTYQSFGLNGPIKEANIENEFVLSNEVKYTAEQWNIGIGYDFIHGGLLGVMAKHYALQGASCVNEFFLAPEYTPAKWFSIGCPVRYSVSGVRGWWFEPSITFKAPVLGTPEDLRMAALLSFNVSLTADYYQDYHGACTNGTQAFWIKLATPYFAGEKKNWIITPSVSFNWLGKSAIDANKNSEYKELSEDSSNVPFRNFAVVGTLSCTYVF